MQRDQSRQREVAFRHADFARRHLTNDWLGFIKKLQPRLVLADFLPGDFHGRETLLNRAARHILPAFESRKKRDLVHGLRAAR